MQLSNSQTSESWLRSQQSCLRDTYRDGWGAKKVGKQTKKDGKEIIDESRKRKEDWSPKDKNIDRSSNRWWWLNLFIDDPSKTETGTCGDMFEKSRARLRVWGVGVSREIRGREEERQRGEKETQTKERSLMCTCWFWLRWGAGRIPTNSHTELLLKTQSTTSWQPGCNWESHTTWSSN